LRLNEEFLTELAWRKPIEILCQYSQSTVRDSNLEILQIKKNSNNFTGIFSNKLSVDTVFLPDKIKSLNAYSINISLAEQF
jgi:hypothetical protein